MKSDAVVRALAGLAVAAAGGALGLAWLDSPWAALCALASLTGVTLLALYAGVAAHGERRAAQAG